jgi:hypothetical protein
MESHLWWLSLSYGRSLKFLCWLLASFPGLNHPGLYKNSLLDTFWLFLTQCLSFPWRIPAPVPTHVEILLVSYLFDSTPLSGHSSASLLQSSLASVASDGLSPWKSYSLGGLIWPLSHSLVSLISSRKHSDTHSLCLAALSLAHCAWGWAEYSMLGYSPLPGAQEGWIEALVTYPQNGKHPKIND